jgi:hypothetical protein
MTMATVMGDSEPSKKLAWGPKGSREGDLECFHLLWIAFPTCGSPSCFLTKASEMATTTTIRVRAVQEVSLAI